MKIMAAAVFSMTLTGCASLLDVIPSFWDDNQSASIVNTRLVISNIDCARPQSDQVTAVSQNIQWFQLYSESKGRLQQDVLRIVEPMSNTVSDWQRRIRDTGEPSQAYCESKKKILTAQARLAAQAVLGRY